MTTPAYDRTIRAAAHGGRFTPDPPAFDVVHSTEGPMSDGNAVALAEWFARSKADGGPGTSATGIFDPVSSVRMLDEHIVPFHVGPAGNGLCTGDEHCGSVKLTPAQWMSPRGQAMLDASAKVKAQRAHFRGWSLADCRWLSVSEVARRTVKGFCTHNDIRLALGGTTHSDPGPNFPYAWYMGRIRAWYQDPVNGGDDMHLSDDDKAWLRSLTGAGGGKTVTGVTEGAFNALHADMTDVQARLQRIEDKLGGGETPPIDPTPAGA